LKGSAGNSKGGAGAADFKNNLFENYNKSTADNLANENTDRVKVMKSDKLMEDFETIDKVNYIKYAVRKIEMKNKKELRIILNI